MRRLLTALCALSLSIFLPFDAASASRAGRAGKRVGRTEPARVIQPVADDGGLVLLSSPGWAKVKRGKRARRVQLGPDEQLTTLVRSGPGWIAAGVRRTTGGSRVFAIRSGSGRMERLPGLPVSAATQLKPVLLEFDGELLGAAWLEGNDFRSMKVRYSDWTGLDWAPTQTVAGRAPGSQTGLAGIALDKDELLLSWSRFDGQDDEIFWSQRNQRTGPGWTGPERLGPDNSVPDVTPTLTRTQRGAVLAWGRLDQGNYRVLTRAFHRSRWRAESFVSAPGGVFPSVTSDGESVKLLYRMAAPTGWTVVELDETGAERRRAEAIVSRTERPIVSIARRGGARLRWAEGSKKDNSAGPRARRLTWRPSR